METNATREIAAMLQEVEAAIDKLRNDLIANEGARQALTMLQGRLAKQLPADAQTESATDGDK